MSFKEVRFPGLNLITKICSLKCNNSDWNSSRSMSVRDIYSKGDGFVYNIELFL